MPPRRASSRSAAAQPSNTPGPGAPPCVQAEVDAEGLARQEGIPPAQDDRLAEVSASGLPERLREAFARVKPLQIPGWLSLPSLPPIRVPGGRLADAEIMALLTALSTPGDRVALITQLKAHADAASLDAFACRLLELWEAAGSSPDDTWAMAAVGRLGGDGCVEKLAALIGAQTQPARMALWLTCLGDIGSDAALMALANLASRLNVKALKQKARARVEEIAADRGLTPEQLADRVVPDCGLDARGSRVFDFGARQFHLVLGPDLKPQLRDGSGKVRSDLPAPAKTDDPAKALAAVADWKILKKTLREVLRMQAGRLEDAMVIGRRWTTAELKSVLVRHPLTVRLVRSLVLAVYDDTGRVDTTFRVTEERTFADQNDTEISLTGSGKIGVAHPVELDEATRAAWGVVLGDYRIIAPFAQLSRDIHRPDSEDLEATEITRLRGKTVSAVALHDILGRRHWRSAEPADGGSLLQHCRYFPRANLTAFLRYGTWGHGHLAGERDLESIFFVQGDVDPAWPRHGSPMRIKEVDAVVLSEVLLLAHATRSRAPAPDP